MFRIWVLAAAVVAVQASSSANPITGPVSPLYFADGDGISVLQGTRIVRTIPSAYGEMYRYEGAFAVTETIRTRGEVYEPYYNSGPVMGRGGVYTLTGTPTGVSYVVPLTGSDRVYDGTTDGETNYFTDHLYGGVYATDSYWGNPRFLFNTEEGTEGCSGERPRGYRCGCNTGIAYDPYHQSLWISSKCDSIREYSSQGVRRIGGSGSGLAFDPVDRTLWLSSWHGLQQWSTDGQLLQELPIPGYLGWGSFDGAMEFQVVPEPGTFALFAGGLAMLAVWKRRCPRRG